MPALAQLSPPLIVMVTLIGLLAIVIIIAMLRYKTADEALKIMAFVAPILSLVVGAAGTHFFGEQRIQDVKQSAAESANDSALAMLSVADSLVSRGDVSAARQILSTPTLFRAVSPDVLDQHDLRVRELPASEPAADGNGRPAASPTIELGSVRYLARTGNARLAEDKLNQLRVRPGLTPELQAEIRSLQQDLSPAPQ